MGGEGRVVRLWLSDCGCPHPPPPAHYQTVAALPLPTFPPRSYDIWQAPIEAMLAEGALTLDQVNTSLP